MILGVVEGKDAFGKTSLGRGDAPWGVKRMLRRLPNSASGSLSHLVGPSFRRSSWLGLTASVSSFIALRVQKS